MKLVDSVLFSDLQKQSEELPNKSGRINFLVTSAFYFYEDGNLSGRELFRMLKRYLTQHQISKGIIYLSGNGDLVPVKKGRLSFAIPIDFKRFSLDKYEREKLHTYFNDTRSWSFC